MNIKENFLKNLKSAREAKYTQAEFADKLGISRVHLSNLETGKTGLDLDKLIEISSALEIPLSSLLPLEEAQGNDPDRDTLHILIDRCPKEGLRTLRDVVKPFVEMVIQKTTAR